MDTTSQAERNLIGIMQQIADLDTEPKTPDNYIRMMRLKAKALALVDKIERDHDTRRRAHVRKVREAQYAESMGFTLRG